MFTKKATTAITTTRKSLNPPFGPDGLKKREKKKDKNDRRCDVCGGSVWGKSIRRNWASEWIAAKEL